MNWNKALSHRKKLLLVGRISISSFLIYYLFNMLEWDRLRSVLVRTEEWLLIIAPILLLSGLLFSSIRWHYLLINLNIKQRIRDLYAYYLLGSFSSLFLPGVIGGDAVRVGFCSKRTGNSLRVIATSVLIERFCGLVVLLVIGSIALTGLPMHLIHSLGRYETKILSTIMGMGAFLLVASYLTGRRYLKKASPKGNSYGFAGKFLEMLVLSLHLPHSVYLPVILFTALYQISDILACFVIATALDIHLPLIFFFVAMPVVYLFTLLPISMGGIGVREGVLVYLLTKVGVQSSDAVAMSFLIYFNRIFVGSIGGIISIFWKTSRIGKPSMVSSVKEN